MKNGSILLGFCILCLIIGIVYVLTNRDCDRKPINTPSNSSHVDLPDRVRETALRMSFITQEGSTTVLKENPISAREESYQELLEECEAIIEVLDEAEIYHEDISYQMDYDELRILRDELVTIAVDNKIKW